MQYLILTTSVRKDVPRNYLDVASIGTSVYEGKSEVDKYVFSHQVYNATTQYNTLFNVEETLSLYNLLYFFPMKAEKEEKIENNSDDTENPERLLTHRSIYHSRHKRGISYTDLSLEMAKLHVRFIFKK